MREKVGKSRNTVFFQWFVAPEGRKVGSLKRRVRSQLARWEMKICTPLWREAHFEVKMYNILGPLLEVEMLKKCTPLWREAHFQVKMYKTHHARTTFGSWDVEKVHAVVARSTFWSQNEQNTPFSDHFWKLRYWKSACRCGAKHILKSKCTKTPHVRATFGGSDVISRGRRKGLWTLSKVNKTWGFCGIFNYNHHYTTLHSNTLHYTTTTTTPWLHSTTLHSTTTLHCTQLHSNTLNYTTHYTTLHYTTLHYTTLHYITPHYTTFHYTTLHYTTLHYNYNYPKIHYTTLHYTTLHYIPLHSTTLRYITLNDTAPQIDR